MKFDSVVILLSWVKTPGMEPVGMILLLAVINEPYVLLNNLRPIRCTVDPKSALHSLMLDIHENIL